MLIVDKLKNSDKININEVLNFKKKNYQESTRS